MNASSATIQIEPGREAVFAQAGLDAQTLFTDPRIHLWRDLPERQNATFDFVSPDGATHRWHIKRYFTGHAADVEREVRGIHLLRDHGIPTVPLVAHGKLPDGRAFLITDDLAGLVPADKLPPATIPAALPPIVELAARLHAQGLHHQDLYLCHFFVRPSDPAHEVPVHLIDAGRVRRLPPWPFRFRWIVKDLAQLIFSLRRLNLPADADRALANYCQLRHPTFPRLLRVCINYKIRRIAAHDHRLRQKQPGRNVSLQTPSHS